MKEKIPTYVLVSPPHDWWTRLQDAAPFLIGLLLLALMSFLYFERSSNWMDSTVDRIKKRLQEMEERLKAVEEGLRGIDKTVMDYPEWRRVVAGLQMEFQAMKEKAQRKDPLEAIVKEQSALRR